MPILDSIRAAAEAHLDQYIANLIPEHAQDKVRIGYLAKGMAISLFELQDQHGKWHIYAPMPPAPDSEKCRGRFGLTRQGSSEG